MKRILVFEPWHLGDVAIALSIIKQFKQEQIEFSIVCDTKWKEWVLSTGFINKVFAFSPAWTMRKQRDKYNLFNYHLNEILEFRKNVLEYRPDIIIDLRGDIRASFFFKLIV